MRGSRNGDLVGERFEIEELAGAGGMGLVYRAHDRVTGAPVAVKVLRAGAEVERFGREARLLAELQHPGIVRYVAHGTSSEGPFLAMEWLDGVTLAQRLEIAELTLAESVSLIGQVASAIGAAHRRLVVHRDLKPSNVFLVDGSADRIKVMDFGVARQGMLSSDLTRTGMVLGSPRYMSPEQASGKRDLGPESDVWSLGVLAFRCLTGRSPFEGESLELVLADILLSTPPRVRSIAPAVPAELDELVACMLERDPGKRPAAGQDVASVLESLDLEPKLSAHAPERHALTRAEQRFTCVIAVRGAAGSAEVLRSVATAFGAGVLPGEAGLSVVVLSERGTTGDLTVQAARCALAIADELPDAAIALVMGAGPATEHTRSDRTLASRAEGLLGGESRAGIRLDDAAVGLLESRFEIGGPDGARRLLGERRDGARVRRLLGRATPCVGRNRELATLLALWEECAGEGVSRVALVTGPSGIGKSRLRYELLRKLEGSGGEVWLGRGDPSSAGAPFGILADALRPVLGVQLGAPLAEQHARIAERVARHVPDAERLRIQTFLGELIGVAGDGGHADLALAREDPVLMGDQIRAAFEDFVDAETAHAPVLCVLEDLQWGDWPTIKLIDAALRRLPERPLLVLGIGRPELADLFPGLWAERGAQGITLGELPRKAAELLVRDVLGERVNDERVAAIVARAMGNAFFLEELIRAEVERPEASDLPPSVLAMAQARVQALDPDARRVLRAASVFGNVFWRGGVEALLGGFAALDEWLVVLTERELVAPRRSSQFPDEAELVFRHGLIRDAAYAMLTESDRALGHRLAAEWLEAKHADPLVVAEHHQLGERPARAAQHLLRVAAHALEGDDFAGALAHADRALASGLEPEAQGEAHFIRAQAYHWKGEMPEAEAASATAMQYLAPRSSRWYSAAALAARIASRLGRHDRLATLVDQLPADDRPETAPDRAMALSMIGVPAVRAGQERVADRVFELVTEVEAALGDERSARHLAARAWLARLRGYRALVAGDTVAYLRETETAVELLRKGGDHRNAATFATSVGYALIALGQHAAATRVLSEALAAAIRIGLGTAQTVAKHNLGYAVAMLGDVEQGIALERDAISEAARHGDRWTECASWSYLADLLIRAGDATHAELAARRALELANPASQAFANALLARALLRQGDVTGALEASRESRALIEQLGSIEDGDALARLVHAEVLEAAGYPHAARATIEDAHQRLQARAERIVDPLLRRSFLENVPENAATVERFGRLSER